ncbi:DUF4352 domain-containing protein [Streptomyces sp. TRM 70361]|uniref:DUF4352 domain-containing protein n=1 Tax=Streptomyces sp. TRM 70361 TaxID=3116553 RepID=UPI002E7B64DA|nr:DUF4352 domain-containing protein [Streptomyces sp. TRM 70361]MEE1938525.1 DUF4352 domain-containing protein [Streptomyces sp. TRM 70361]
MPAQQNRPARKRLTAAAAVAVLALGGLTACGTAEEPTTTKATASGADKSGDAEDAGDAGKKETETAEDGPLGAGDTASYDSGLSITVSEAVPYTPGEFSIGHTEGNKAHKVTVTLENAGDEKIDISLVMPAARAGEEGVNAEQVFDDKVGEGFQGNLLPGRKATAEYVFDAPADARNLDVEVDLLDFTTEPAQWSLPL